MRRSHLALPLLLAAAACGGGRHVPIGKVSGTFAPTAAVEALVAELGSGSIVVEHEPGPEVRIRAEVRVREGRAREYEGAQLEFSDHVRVAQSGGAVTVGSAHDGDADASDWQILLTVGVPLGIDVTAALGAGRAEVRLDEAETIDATVDAGEIVISSKIIADHLRAQVGAGRIRIAVGASAPRNGAEVSCSTGNVIVSLPQIVDGVFDVSADVGNVSIDPRFGIGISRSTTGSRAQGQVGNGRARYALSADVGQVEVR
jgi:hypothetical protein